MKKAALSLFLLMLALPARSQCVPAVSTKEMFASRGTVEMGANVCPLSSDGKAKLFLVRATSPFNIVSAAASAGIWQATQNSHQGFGQGWRAYGSRFGASLANQESAEFLRTLVFSSALHMDPRYFRKGSGSAGSRLAYALSRVLVGRTDAGRATLNAPELLGTMSSAALSNAYYPQSDRTVSRTLASAGLTIASDAGWNILREFGVELGKKIGRNKK